MNGITRHIDSVKPLQGWGMLFPGALPGRCPSLVNGRPFGAAAFHIVTKCGYPEIREEIAKSNSNLNIPRYVDTFTAEKEASQPRRGGHSSAKGNALEPGISGESAALKGRNLNQQARQSLMELAGYLKELGK